MQAWQEYTFLKTYEKGKSDYMLDQEKSEEKSKYIEFKKIKEAERQ